MSNDATDLRDRAIGLLARREHSRRELHLKLVRKGYEASDVAPVLDDLEAERLLSDERYAVAYVESRAGRGFGPVRIIEELKQRGIPSPACREVCDPDSQDWDFRARHARSKRFGDGAPVTFEERARQARFLAGRGFNRSQVNAALAGDADGVGEGNDARDVSHAFPDD